MISYCPHCNTGDGLQCINMMRGPRARPKFKRICDLGKHVDPIGVCDICKNKTKAVETRRAIVEWASFEVPGWEELQTGRFVPYYSAAEIQKFRDATGFGTTPLYSDKDITERMARVKKEVVHVCAECAKALRDAQQVAFDVCMAQRDSINA